ncbi:hypothetical protein CDAR_261811 [Caerostris darwini]|uniref:Uncharacterized protein n=1 Tax=Caerostris darwini TaxID=1538125 RepID=A0AAV4V0W2_9ARAC|nr:hypothetical protein CDAR_261811 [Caerostris darwini]
MTPLSLSEESPCLKTHLAIRTHAGRRAVHPKVRDWRPTSSSRSFGGYISLFYPLPLTPLVDGGGWCTSNCYRFSSARSVMGFRVLPENSNKLLSLV